MPKYHSMAQVATVQTLGSLASGQVTRRQIWPFNTFSGHRMSTSSRLGLRAHTNMLATHNSAVSRLVFTSTAPMRNHGSS